MRWYAEAGAFIQERLAPFAVLVTAARVDLARRRELIRSGADGWAAAIAQMARWAYACDTNHEPRPWDWPEDELTSFIQHQYPQGVAGFIADRDAESLRAPAEVNEHLRMQAEALARWQSHRLGLLLDLAADPREHSALRAMAGRLALGEDIDEPDADR